MEGEPNTPNQVLDRLVVVNRAFDECVSGPITLTPNPNPLRMETYSNGGSIGISRVTGHPKKKGNSLNRDLQKQHKFNTQRGAVQIPHLNLFITTSATFPG